MATIVTKLFNIVQPDRAYFGQKDAAQCVLIRRIVEDLNMNVQVQVLDTVRESDGLAMSSRNAYLDPEHRRAAPVVYQSLCNAKSLFLNFKEDPERDELPSSEIEKVVRATLLGEPLVSEIQYVSIDSAETMQPIESLSSNGGAVVSLACKLGSVRLIDNILI